MIFLVGGTMIVGGAFILWGSLSGRLAKMLAAIFSPGSLTQAGSSGSAGFEHLGIAGTASQGAVAGAEAAMGQIPYGPPPAFPGMVIPDASGGAVAGANAAMAQLGK